jgi:hypothetical protein
MDPDEELNVQMENDDVMISKFRSALQKIKISVQDKYTLKSQNTSMLRNVEKELVQFFGILNPIIFCLKSLDTIPDKLKSLRNNFKDTLQDYPRSSYYQNMLQYYLIHDLIKNPIDNNIIPNSSELTKL